MSSNFCFLWVKANLRGGRSLQYDNIPNAIITFSNNPSGASEGIAQTVSTLFLASFSDTALHL
jgi:hypothetical protein